MKKFLLFIISLLSSVVVFSQHCPWDCSGLILLQTDVPKEKLYQMRPVLVDENKRKVIHAISGTGTDSKEDCNFLSYEDFTTSRTRKINLNPWYAYDTVYHFATGKYMVRYNHCSYLGKKLYLRYYDPYTRGLTYRYIEIPENMRIHLHSYSGLLNKGKTEELKVITTPFVLNIRCEQWKLREKDCK